MTQCGRQIHPGLAWLSVLCCIFSGGCTRAFHITESYKFSAAGKPAKIRLGVLLPRNGPYQEIRNQTFSGAKVISREARGEVESVKLEGEVITGHPCEVLVSYEVRLSRKRPRWQMPAKPEYLAPQPSIQSDSKDLRDCAREVVANKKNMEAAYAIYRFVGRHLHGPRGSRESHGTKLDPSALTAYKTGIGVCGECANLMTALCRASGMPARSVGGIVFTKPLTPFFPVSRTWNHPGIAHQWVEYQVDGQWRTTDPSLACFAPLRKLFFYSHGALLSYGESDTQEQFHGELADWCKQNGRIVGAMSGPLYFAASTSAAGVRIQPSIKVKKRWIE